MKSDHTLPDDLIRATTEYMKAASAVYRSEVDRQEALTPLLRNILGVNIQMVANADKTTPDVCGNADRSVAFPDSSSGR